MNILRKKLKKTNGVQKFFYFISVIAYGIALAYFIYGLRHLKGIETTLRIAVITFFSVWYAIYILGGLIAMLAKKPKTFIFITTLTLIFTPMFVASSYLINHVYGALNSMVHNEIEYTTNLITMKENNFSASDIIGMIETETDIEGNQLPKKLIEQKKLHNKIKYYDDYTMMISDMYSGKIGACFVSSNYAINFENEEFDDKKLSIGERVKVVYEYSEVMENQDITVIGNNKEKTLTEPFTMLIMGVDSAKDGLKANQAFNGDTLIMVTFNPNTLTATMFSMPRDMYVPIACNHNKYARVNSSAAYGSSCVIKTLEQITGIKVDYYLKMNFKGVVDLVNALGGVTVDVEEPTFSYNRSVNCGAHMVCEQNSSRQFGKKMIYVPTGVQKLTGEQALAYARNRHQYATSDIARNQHQQQLIEAMAKQLKDVDYKGFNSILNAVSKNLETNMTADQILSFYSVGKDMLTNSNSSALSIKKTYLTYYNLNITNPRRISALGYYQESLDAIIHAMKVNLGQASETPVKTFSISYNENYETPVIGKGLYGGTKLELMKSFVGSNQSKASAYCNANGIHCTFVYVKGSAPYGQITKQSLKEGYLLKNFKDTVTFYMSDGSSVVTKPEPEPEEEDPGSGDKPGEGGGSTEPPIVTPPETPTDPTTPEQETSE